MSNAQYMRHRTHSSGTKIGPYTRLILGSLDQLISIKGGGFSFFFDLSTCSLLVATIIWCASGAMLTTSFIVVYGHWNSFAIRRSFRGLGVFFRCPGFARGAHNIANSYYVDPY